MLAKEFIESVCLTSFKNIVETEKYVGFIPIFIGIEFIGKCLNEKVQFDDESYAPFHNFKLGIHEFDKKYHKLKLFELCRNGFAHFLLPKPNAKVVFGHRNKMNDGTIGIKKPNLHYHETQIDKRVLYIEDFYEDFAAVCRKVVQMIDNKEFANTKMYGGVLIITPETPSINPPMP